MWAVLATVGGALSLVLAIVAYLFVWQYSGECRSRGGQPFSQSGALCVCPTGRALRWDSFDEVHARTWHGIPVPELRPNPNLPTARQTCSGCVQIPPKAFVRRP